MWTSESSLKIETLTPAQIPKFLRCARINAFSSYYQYCQSKFSLNLRYTKVIKFIKIIIISRIPISGYNTYVFILCISYNKAVLLWLTVKCSVTKHCQFSPIHVSHIQSIFFIELSPLRPGSSSSLTWTIIITAS